MLLWIMNLITKMKGRSFMFHENLDSFLNKINYKFYDYENGYLLMYFGY